MNDYSNAYGPDILLALVSTATFGGWGLAGAAIVSLARHSPVVQEGVAQLAPQLTERARRLPELLTATPSDRAVIRHERKPVTPQTARAAPQTQARRPRWLEVVNDDPDRTPHTLIIGGTGAGKTTLATAIAEDRGGRVVVLSPKVSAGNWRGAEVVSVDDDGTYAPILSTLADLEDEKRRRIVALRKHGPMALEPLTIVLDELQQLTTHAPTSGEFMVGLSSIGREIKMRMIVSGTTDDALNIRGWKASRGNYARIDLDRNRRATISDGTRTMTVLAQDSKRIADAARLVPWRQTAEQTPLPEPEPITRPLAAENTRPLVVTERVHAPRPAAPPVDLSDLLDSLLAEVPPAAQQSVRIARDGGDVNVYVRQEAATVARATRRVRREGAVNVRDRARRLVRKAYYAQAAREGRSLQSAYDARSPGDKGDYNEAAHWYREAKRTMQAS